MNGSWGVGLVAFDRLFEQLPYYIGAVVLIGAIWIVSWCRR